MKSSEVRERLKAIHVPHWRLAKMAGCAEDTLLRWLRDDEIKPERSERLETALEKLEAEYGRQ